MFGLADDEDGETDQGPDGTSHIKREWVWMPKSKAVQRVKEMNPPSKAEPLKLEGMDIASGSLLFGIESSAPLRKDLFGGTHSAAAKSKDTSAFGRRKWRDFRKNGRVTGQPPAPICLKVPAELGGVQAIMTQAKFEEIVTICEKICFLIPSEPKGGSQDFFQEEDFFKKLLCSDGSSSENLIRSYYAASDLRSSPIGDLRPSAVNKASDNSGDR
jgi:hypothetical protein